MSKLPLSMSAIGCPFHIGQILEQEDAAPFFLGIDQSITTLKGPGWLAECRRLGDSLEVFGIEHRP